MRRRAFHRCQSGRGDAEGHAREEARVVAGGDGGEDGLQSGEIGGGGEGAGESDALTGGAEGACSAHTIVWNSVDVAEIGGESLR